MKIQRRQFLSTLAVTLASLPFLTGTAKSEFIYIALLVVLVVAAYFIYRLWQTAKDALWKTPPPSEPDKDGNLAPPSPPSNTQQANLSKPVPLDKLLTVDYFWQIGNNQTDAFLDPSGKDHYAGFMAFGLESTTDLKTWTPAGRVMAWMNEAYLKIRQTDAAGVTSSTVLTNWKNAGQVPIFQGGFPYADARDFRLVSLYPATQ